MYVWWESRKLSAILSITDKSNKAAHFSSKGNTGVFFAFILQSRLKNFLRLQLYLYLWLFLCALVFFNFLALEYYMQDACSTHLIT